MNALKAETCINKETEINKSILKKSTYDCVNENICHNSLRVLSNFKPAFFISEADTVSRSVGQD